MQPEGEFMKSLYSAKMPESVSFYLFFGHRGSRNPFRANNDETIALSSLLDWRSQSEAEKIYAFNEDHASIATSKEVLALYNTIINTFDEKHDDSLHKTGGYLQLHFSYDYPTDGVKPWPSLVLRPEDKKHAETLIFLSPGDNGKILGPFPAGDYSVSIYAEAVKPGQKSVSVAIESTKTKALNFVFKPDGIIAGYVTAALKPEDRPGGMPATSYLPVDNKVAIQSITLKGNGIHRVLYPIEGNDVNPTDYFISRADFCHNGYFHFFGLPAGVYELAITAEGYKPIIENHFATPGKQKNYKVIELKPGK